MSTFSDNIQKNNMDKTINLQYCGNNVYIFDVDDWIVLRKTHRIVGNLVGNPPETPRLPSQLLPEEALLLLDKGIAKIVHEEYERTEEMAEKFDKFTEELFKEEQIAYRERRKSQLEQIIDKIVQGKRKRGDNRTQEEIFNEELEKSSKITRENMIWPVFLRPIFPPKKITEIPRDTIVSLTTHVRLLVFKDLWEKGYYVTTGIKFGGDFLAYLGDPILYHSIFIVRCLDDDNEAIFPTEIVSKGRLATSVRKRAVLATVNRENNKVSYITINWIDASTA